MPIDSAGKGIAVGATVTIAATVVSVTEHGGGEVILKMPDGKFRYVRQQKTSPYTLGGTPTITGTVLGFVDGGLTAVVQESDKNIVAIPCSGCTAS